jgi:type VI secretion system protein
MAIKLRVISDQYRELGENRSRVFGVNGGTIGRAPDNDWVLPDPRRIVSGHHCEIEYRGGSFWLRDTSTNGVFVNESEDPASAGGPLELQDGDRLRMGDYELIVSVDSRIDFLPAAAEEHSAAKHLDAGLGADLDVDSLFSRPDRDPSGSLSVRNAFGLKAPRDRLLARPAGALPDRAPPHVAEIAGTPPPAVAAPESSPAGLLPESLSDSPPDWALSTRAITRRELADAMARRQSRIAARQQVQPFHQQASTWSDLNSAVQAFCRGAGIEPASLSPEAQAMLPLVAGQLLREAVVGLNELAQARAKSTPAQGSGAAAAPPSGTNPLRSSSGVDQALVRLFESHGRVQGGPVDSLRDVVQEGKDHEIAMQAALRSALDALLAQLAPANVADQFEQGRARSLAPGQDSQAGYWDYFTEFHRMLTQHPVEGLPHPFAEAFAQAYARTRDELRSGRRDREPGA